jgi:hypothetical protein
VVGRSLDSSSSGKRVSAGSRFAVRQYSGRVANENVEVTRGYHERTKHSEERLRANPHHLDWDNQPFPFKLYRDLETIPPLVRETEPVPTTAVRGAGARAPWRLQR